eukprot:3697526-Amphidinium_carterae.1
MVAELALTLTEIAEQEIEENTRRTRSMSTRRTRIRLKRTRSTMMRTMRKMSMTRNRKTCRQ